MGKTSATQQILVPEDGIALAKTKVGVSKQPQLDHLTSIHPYFQWSLLQLCLRIEQQAHDPACRVAGAARN